MKARKFVNGEVVIFQVEGRGYEIGVVQQYKGQGVYTIYVDEEYVCHESQMRRAKIVPVVDNDLVETRNESQVRGIDEKNNFDILDFFHKFATAKELALQQLIRDRQLLGNERWGQGLDVNDKRKIQDGRTWVDDALEEALDGIQYIIAEQLRRLDDSPRLDRALDHMLKCAVELVAEKNEQKQGGN